MYLLSAAYKSLILTAAAASLPFCKANAGQLEIVRSSRSQAQKPKLAATRVKRRHGRSKCWEDIQCGPKTIQRTSIKQQHAASIMPVSAIEGEDVWWKMYCCIIIFPLSWHAHLANDAASDILLVRRRRTVAICNVHPARAGWQD